jgi:predicted transposase YbfD/YdcC
VAGKRTRETAYLVVSLPADRAQTAELQDWVRREWHIENSLHWIRSPRVIRVSHDVAQRATRMGFTADLPGCGARGW